MVENSPAMQEKQEIRVQSLGWENPLEEEMATHFSILAWRIPWAEEPGGSPDFVSQFITHFVFKAEHIKVQIKSAAWYLI